MEHEAKRDRIEIGDVLGEVFSIYTKRFKILIAFAALCFIIPTILSLILGDSSLASIINSILNLFASLLFIGLVVSVVRDYSENKESDFGVNLNLVLPKLGTLFLSSLVKTALILVGLILLVVPGIYLAIRLSMSEAIIVNEDAGPIEALKRSGEMTEGIKWRIFFISLILILIILAVILALSFVVIGISLLGVVLSSGAGIVAAVITALLAFLIAIVIQPLGVLWAPSVYFRLLDSDSATDPEVFST